MEKSKIENFDKKIKINYWDKPFIKRILKNAFPLMIGTILSGLIALTDNFMIGILQTKASGELAAASLSNKFINIMNVFIQSAIAMFAFFVMQYIGNKDKKSSKETFKIIILIGLLVTAIFIILGWFLNNEIMHFFQGKNFNDLSTKTGTAQNYLRTLIFIAIPTTLFSIYLIGLAAFEKQKIIIPISIFTIFINAILNFLFYKVAHLGLKGIAISTLIANILSVIIIVFYISKKKFKDYIFFNILKIFNINTKILIFGLKRFFMMFQGILWGMIAIFIKIIYSRWYGDVANNQLAIASPIIGMFYSSLDGIATTKGKFVGQEIGKQNKQRAYVNDKKINLYTFIVATFEGVLMISLAYPLPLAWTSATSQNQFGTTLILIFVGLTYPIAALSKTLLGSFKVAGMGKTIVLSNGLFALLFEFLIPFILFIINFEVVPLYLEFWQLYLISRLLKLTKLSPTLYYWKKLKWLNRSI